VFKAKPLGVLEVGTLIGYSAILLEKETYRLVGTGWKLVLSFRVTGFCVGICAF